MLDLMSRASSLHSADSPRIQRRSRYFQAMSMLLLGVVLIGFGKTFFLRSLFQVPPIQWYVYVHALMQTAWFGLLVLQTTLVSANRTDVHRRFGVFGALLAVAVAGLSLVTVLGLPRHFSSGQLSIDVPFDLEGITNIFWNDLGSLVIFVVLVGAAILLRQRSEVHKRLMLLASIRISGPAVLRTGILLSSWIHPLSTTQMQGLFTAVVVGIVLPLSLVAYDLLVRRRIHSATLAGVAFNIAVTIASVALAASSEGRALVIAFE